jgi:hypothetical protein
MQSVSLRHRCFTARPPRGEGRLLSVQEEETMRVSMLALVVSLLAGACYTTKIRTRAGSPVAGPTFQQRQWFTVGGLVPLSKEAGDECAGGVAYAESSMRGVDILIAIGLSVASAAIGANVCELPDDPAADEARDYGTCVGSIGSVGPLLFASRTVR